MDEKTVIEGRIPGDKSKRYTLWRVRENGELIECMAEADSLEQLSTVRRRLDWLYQIRLDGKPLPS